MARSASAERRSIMSVSSARDPGFSALYTAAMVELSGTSGK
jgi:hypothetical protein